MIAQEMSGVRRPFSIHMDVRELEDVWHKSCMIDGKLTCVIAHC